MSETQKPGKTLNIALWVAQVLLAATMIWAASMKLFEPVEELATMWPWTAEHPSLVKITGVIDLLAALGLILPMLLNTAPRLTQFAAYGTIVLLIAASAFHISRGEPEAIGVNIFFALLAAFIAWGRRKV